MDDTGVDEASVLIAPLGVAMRGGCCHGAIPSRDVATDVTAGNNMISGGKDIFFAGPICNAVVNWLPPRARALSVGVAAHRRYNLPSCHRCRCRHRTAPPAIDQESAAAIVAKCTCRDAVVTTAPSRCGKARRCPCHPKIRRCPLSTSSETRHWSSGRLYRVAALIAPEELAAAASTTDNSESIAAVDGPVMPPYVVDGRLDGTP